MPTKTVIKQRWLIFSAAKFSSYQIMTSWGSTCAESWGNRWSERQWDSRSHRGQEGLAVQTGWLLISFEDRWVSKCLLNSDLEIVAVVWIACQLYGCHGDIFVVVTYHTVRRSSGAISLIKKLFFPLTVHQRGSDLPASCRRNNTPLGGALTPPPPHTVSRSRQIKVFPISGIHCKWIIY